jgi:hypothetical protein
MRRFLVLLFVLVAPALAAASVELRRGLIGGCVLSVFVIAGQRRVATPDRPDEYVGKINQLLERDSANRCRA